MAKKQIKSPVLILFYILAAYVLLQFVWWGYHIVELNIRLNGNSMSQKTTMVIGEGVVFITILIIGIIKIKNSIVKEFEIRENQRNFLLAITHELKSPIASIKLYLQTMSKRELTPEKQEEVIQRSINDTDRLNALIENILLVGRIDSGNIPLNKEKLNLSVLMEEVLNEARNTFGKNHEIQSDIVENVEMFADRSGMYSVLLNVIENATKYAPKSTTIFVKMAMQGESLKIEVIDNGIGIKHKDKVFNLFFREGDEETRSSKGTGLGLYIVKMMVQAHNGTVNIKDNNPKGSIIEIQF